MDQLPEALQPLAAYPQFINWITVERGGKLVKLPYNPNSTDQTKTVDAHNPRNWLTFEQAVATGYPVGFVFTESDPFFFVDIDGCLNPDGATWSPLALDLIARLPGAAVEVSQSGNGLHIIGQGIAPDHSCKNTALHIELYTEGRFVALTGTNAVGSAAVDLSAGLADVAATYFPPRGNGETADWTDVPVDAWSGLADDTELLAKALSSRSASQTFGASATFADLWTGDEDALARHYPDDVRPYDASSADMALAQHLAFWTGKDCERMRRLMRCSGLRREKWEREDYLVRTILAACSLQTDVYGQDAVNLGDTTIADQYGAPRLKGSAKQQAFAAGIREQVLATANEEQRAALCAQSGPATEASFWIDSRGADAATLVTRTLPVEHAVQPFATETAPGARISEGYQFLGIHQQIEYFRGCVYIQDLHRVFVPDGSLLKPDQFNVVYGGYAFQKEPDARAKTTAKAWQAFTESQAVRYPMAQGMGFYPDREPGAILEKDGRTLVNTYIPYEAPRKAGDPGPFLRHLEKVLPVKHDRDILLAYMAACVQHKGVKFQWTPLLQGTEGNGKTLFTRCVAYAIGKRYTHYPKAMDIDNKFNGWLMGKMFIGVEDIFVPDHRREVLETLKPMITGGDGIEIQLKGADQITADICANFMLNSNHKDAIKKTANDRRFAVFYTAQQTAEDLARDGMLGDYFPDLYDWLNADGYAIVCELLNTWQIPAELNPATHCQRAPETSSTAEAIAMGLGGIEQEIMEAILEDRPGFAGGWVSSMALEKLLDHMRASRAIPPNRRRDLLRSLGYDWHPALRDGRVNSVVPFDAGKPRLFIKRGHIAANLTTAKEVERAYQEAQTKAVEGQQSGAAAQTFTGGGTQ